MPHNGGLAQTQPTFTSLYYEPWCINACKAQDGPWYATVGATNALDNVNTDWMYLLNEKGIPTAMPTGVGSEWRTSQLYTYGWDGDVWVLDWEGSATLSLLMEGTGGSITQTYSSSNRKEYTWTGHPTTPSGDGSASSGALSRIRITSLTSGLDNIRLYPKALEAYINGEHGTGAPSMFTPAFLGRMSGVGAIRFMDWLSINHTRLVRWADRNHVEDHTWGGTKNNGNWYRGAATKSLNTYTVPDSITGIQHGEPIQFFFTRPTRLQVASIIAGNPTTINFTGAHGLSNGNLVQMDMSSAINAAWYNPLGGTKSTTTGLAPVFAATVTDSDTITIPFDSTGFAALTGTMYIFPTIQISDGVTTKRCVRNGMFNHYNSEWGNYASAAVVTAVYDANYDVFVMGGEANSNIHLGGVPFEVCIELSNYIGAHPQFVLSWMANDDFATQLATLVKADLDAGLIPYFEKGNEIWNNGGNFSSTQTAVSDACRRWSTSSSNTAYGARTKETSQALDAVFGSDRPWKMIMAVQWGAGLTTSRFEGNAAINGGSSTGFPINFCDEVHGAPYIVPPFLFDGQANTYAGFNDALANWKSGDTSLKKDAFDWLAVQVTEPDDAVWIAANQRQEPLDFHITQIGVWQSRIAPYTGRQGSLVVGHYEGNLGIFGPDSIDGGFTFPLSHNDQTISLDDFRNFVYEWHESVQCGQVMMKFFKSMHQNGVSLPSQFNLSGSWSTTNLWGGQRMNDFNGPVTDRFAVFKLFNSGKQRFRIK